MVMKFLKEILQVQQIQSMHSADSMHLFCEVNPIPVKTALNLMGKEVGPLRMPLTEMEDEQALAKARNPEESTA